MAIKSQSRTSWAKVARRVLKSKGIRATEDDVNAIAADLEDEYGGGATMADDDFDPATMADGDFDADDGMMDDEEDFGATMDEEEDFPPTASRRSRPRSSIRFWPYSGTGSIASPDT